MKAVVILVGVGLFHAGASGDPLQDHRKLFGELESQYAKHALVVKVRIGSDVSVPIFLSVPKGEGRSVEAIKKGEDVSLNVHSVKDLATIKFVTQDKRLEIVPKTTYSQIASARTETRVIGVSTISVNGRSRTSTTTGTFNIPAKAEIVFSFDNAAVEAARPAEDGTADTEMIRLMGIAPNDIVEIAAATAERQKAQGRWFPVRQGNLFSTIEFLTGIIDGCRSKPEAIADQRKPESHFIPSSSVLNRDAQRVTLAYFIRVKKDGKPENVRAYFSLLSYDLGAIDPSTGVGKCATEFFMFGPFGYQADGATPDTNAPALLAGLAIGADAQLLKEVPIELAKVSNYLGGNGDETVKPGINVAKEGCVKCHGIRDSIPDATGPFPWGR